MISEERFWSHVERGSDDECWDWQASLLNEYGHGQSWDGEQVVPAHRVAYILEKGDPDGYVMHECDNPSCVNPNHLKDGTQKENMEHAVETGRMHNGEDSGPAKLTKEEVEQIRWKVENTDLTQAQIADRYDVTQPTVSAISNGKTW